MGSCSSGLEVSDLFCHVWQNDTYNVTTMSNHFQHWKKALNHRTGSMTWRAAGIVWGWITFIGLLHCIITPTGCTSGYTYSMKTFCVCVCLHSESVNLFHHKYTFSLHVLPLPALSTLFCLLGVGVSNTNTRCNTPEKRMHQQQYPISAHACY